MKIDDIPDPPGRPKDWELALNGSFAIANALFFASDSANIGSLFVAVVCMMNLVWMLIIQRRDSIWTQMVLGIHKTYKKVVENLQHRE